MRNVRNEDGSGIHGKEEVRYCLGDIGEPFGEFGLFVVGSRDRKRRMGL